MSNPVRIYLLHHPDSKLAARLADRVYEWFRLPSLEGIPVYLRSRSVKGRKADYSGTYYGKGGQACAPPRGKSENTNSAPLIRPYL